MAENANSAAMPGPRSPPASLMSRLTLGDPGKSRFRRTIYAYSPRRQIASWTVNGLLPAPAKSWRGWEKHPGDGLIAGLPKVQICGHRGQNFGGIRFNC